jgi:peptide-methionine (S)-S-oxide reductase
VILVAGEAQRKAAEASKAEAEKRRGSRVRTAVEPLSCFWPAEEYHQKYYLQARKPLAAEFKKAWPGGRWFLTTAAARANANANGQLDGEALGRGLEGLVLPEGFLARLQPHLDGSRKPRRVGAGR